jgi:hypothetical protein
MFAATPAARDVTDGFFDLAKFFELLAQGTVIGVPGKSAVECQWCATARAWRTYPMNSFDMAKADSYTETVSILALEA